MSDLSGVLQPLDDARGLPNAHYIDSQTFAQERSAVLFANWSAIGFAKDIPNAGDAKPIDFLGMPLLLVRDQNSKVRVYQNTCRHRGMILIDKPANIRGTIRCPYHSWCYGLDGALRSTPHVGGPGQNLHSGIKRDELGLIEIRSHVFLDVIFVNVDGKADDFERTHAHLLNHWSEFADQPLYSHSDSCFTLQVNTNWKLAVENYCESYHLPWVHPGLNTVSRLEDHYHLQEPMCYSGQGSTVFQKMQGADGQTLPDFNGLSSKWDTASEYIALYPNCLLGVHKDHVFAIVLEPKGVDETHEHVALYYANQDAIGDSYSAMRKQGADFWHTVFVEDIFVVEGMQKGRKGPFFDGGKFSPVMDGPTYLFHQWVATQMQSHST